MMFYMRTKRKQNLQSQRVWDSIPSGGTSTCRTHQSGHKVWTRGGVARNPRERVTVMCPGLCYPQFGFIPRWQEVITPNMGKDMKKRHTFHLRHLLRILRGQRVIHVALCPQQHGVNIFNRVLIVLEFTDLFEGLSLPLEPVHRVVTGFTHFFTPSHFLIQSIAGGQKWQ